MLENRSSKRSFLTLDKDKILYENYQVLSPDGTLMFRCNQKKINWYLSRNLANSIDDKTIQLNFIPNGLGNSGSGPEKSFLISEIKNICVVCGSSEFLSRHHVVPHCYRKHFPTKMKSKNHHDILPVCRDCHESYEKKAFKLKIDLSNTYEIPIQGVTSINPDVSKIRKLHYALSNQNIPLHRINEIKNEIKEILGSYDQKEVDEFLDKNRSQLQIKANGEMVMEKIINLEEFISMWRNHFLNTMDCKFLPKNWNS